MPDDVFRWVIAAAVALACIAFLVQAGVILALYRIAKTTQNKVVPMVDRAEPILEAAQGILVESRPRISEISKEATEIVKLTRQEVNRISQLLDDFNERAKERIAQIDRTVDHTVERVELAGDALKGAFKRPVQEMNGIVSGMKAAISTYAQGGKRSSVDHATQDEEMFI